MVPVIKGVYFITKRHILKVVISIGNHTGRSAINDFKLTVRVIFEKCITVYA